MKPFCVSGVCGIEANRDRGTVRLSGYLAISNLNGETTLSFQIPADKVIDFTNRQKREGYGRR